MADETENQTDDAKEPSTAADASAASTSKVTAENLRVLENVEVQMTVEVGKKMGVFFPNQDGKGTHINISGAGVTKYSKNKDNAVKLIEFLVSPKAQSMFAKANYEYPVNKNVEPSALLKSWGIFKEDTLPLEELGKNNSKAVKIFNEVNWK